MKVKVQDGKVTVGRHDVADHIRELDDGYYNFSIEKWKDSRTNLQNAFIHLCFDVYGNEIGYTPVESKWMLKKQFGINRIIKNKQTGSQELLVRDTSDYNMKEMAVFIDRLLKHFEYDCDIIIDPKVRKQYKIDETTGELEQIK